jgi:hypothetical protein
MLKQFYRVVPLSLVTVALFAGLKSADAEEILIDAQCQPYPPINIAANCRSTSFIDPAKVEINNDNRQFWRRVDYYGTGSDLNQIVRTLLHETVNCSDHIIAATQVVNYNFSGSVQSQSKPLNFVLPKQQTRAQRSAIRFVCNLN